MLRLAVVGLGTAGAAVAALAAQRGLSVIGVDAGSLDEAGARWTNGVPSWAFEETGVACPSGDELRSGPAPFHLVAGWGPRRVTVRSALEVDMSQLSARLRRAAVAAGADLRGGVKVTGRARRGLETTAGKLDADVIVDASGHAGARLAAQPRLAREDLCAAAQFVHRVTDPSGAEAYFRRHGARIGDVVCFSGVAGGYSILNVRSDGHEVGLLTGTIPALGHPSGRKLLDDFVAEEPWIGPRIGGGARAIPIRRAWEVVGERDLALVGDAACQVFAAHGSGIAMELVAARVLVDVLATGGTPWDYNVTWQRRAGGLLASSDLFRRFSQTLDPRSIATLMRRGVLTPALMEDTMAQRPARPPARALLRAGLGLFRTPRLGRSLVPVLARMRLVEHLYRSYPSNPAQLHDWARRLQRVDPRAPTLFGVSDSGAFPRPEAA